MKKIIQNLTLVILLLVLSAVPVRAEEDAVLLQADGDKVGVTLVPETGSEEKICSLQVSFKISSDKGAPKANEVSFTFDSAVNSYVKEYRYQADKGILTVYLSGSEDILTDGGSGRKTSLALGNVAFSSSASGNYTVKIEENSLKTVNGTSYMEIKKNDSKEEVKVTVGDTQKPTTSNPGGSSSGSSGSDGWSSDDSDGRRPSSSGTGNRFPSFVTSNNTTAPGTNQTVVVNPSPAPGNSETTPANNSNNPGIQQPQSSPAAENGTTAASNSSQPSSTTKNNSSGSGNNGTNISQSGTENESKEENGSEPMTEKESDSQTSAPEETETQTQSESEALTEAQTSDVEVSAQPDREIENGKNSSGVTWLIVIFAAIAVVSAGAVMVMKMSDDPKKKSSKNNRKK